MKSISELINESNTEIEFDNYEIFLEDELIKIINRSTENNLTPSILESQINNICTSIHCRASGQENWDWYLYENLQTTLDTDKFIEKIKNNFSHYKLEIIRNDFDSKYNQFIIKCNDIKKLASNKNFIELCDNANYEIIINQDQLTIKPIKGKDVTDEVYKYPIIYHITPKYIYEDKIKKFGISPKGKSKQKSYGSKYKRIYCFYSKDPMKLAPTFARIKKRFALYDYGHIESMNQNINKGYVILSIDLSKYKERKIKFFEDSGQKGYNAFWTFDFIPYWCITEIKDIEL